jgi:tripartite-type tricarboxylate transporter receptor subunit TctC
MGGLVRLDFNRVISLGIILLGTSLLPTTAGADDYFKGKTVSILVGGGSGGGYDTYARFLAPYYAKHLPGNPSVIVKNLPGAGTLQVANNIYKVAIKDGTVIGAIDGTNTTGHLLHSQGVQFDPREFTWIGSMNSEVSLVVAWHTSPFTSFSQVLDKEMIVAGSGPTSGSVVFANIMNNVLHTKFKIISGYQGTNDMALAMERGEVQGITSVYVSSIVSGHPDWLQGSTVPLVQIGRQRHPLLPDVPLIFDFAKTEEQREILEIVFSAPDFGRPFIAPPGVSAPVATTLRKAFEDSIHDPALIADAEQHGLTIYAPMTGQEIQDRIKKFYDIPPAIVAKAAASTGVSVDRPN